MKKKVISVVLSLILVLSLTGGACAESGRTKITIWHMLSGVGAEAFDQIVANFNASQDKYEAVAEFQGNWYDNFAKFKATPKEDLPDLYQIVVECMGWLAESDRIIPVQKYIDRDNFDVSSMQENIRNLYTLNDTLYCMPLSVTMLALNYNTEVLEAAGIDPATLKTVADVDAAAKKIVDAGLCKKGFSL
ncbi:MAG: extracellular solute-binding protein, partial [Clostridiales bacterium]|nr:extracellular solute-binding protein [Clostridiales bacterium]